MNRRGFLQAAAAVPAVSILPNQISRANIPFLLAMGSAITCMAECGGHLYVVLKSEPQTIHRIELTS